MARSEIENELPELVWVDERGSAGDEDEEKRPKREEDEGGRIELRLGVSICTGCVEIRSFLSSHRGWVVRGTRLTTPG